MEILLFIFPLLSFLLFQFSSKKIKTEFLYALHIILIAISFILSLYVFFKILNLDKDVPQYFYTLLKFDHLFIDWYLRFDILVSSIIIIVTFIGLILSIYSITSIDDFSKKFKINSYLSLSIFSLLVVITSNNLIQFFLAWYLIILSSYLMAKISKNQIDNRNNFFQNRFSDLCLFLSLYFFYKLSNSINLDVIFKSFPIVENNSTVSHLTFSNLDIVIFTLFFSFLLRCRQFYISNSRYDLLSFNSISYSLVLFGLFLPLGLYIILRFLTLNQISSDFFNVLLLMGTTFIFIFSILLTRTYNLKKILLYIASAQFGILLIAVGLKLFSAVVFYFFTSALSLLILSLSFGVISSQLNNEQDIRKMGYLIFKCPSIFLFILIGFTSLLGIPYFSGFYSNQLIFFEPSLINKESYFLIFTYCFLYTFIISYISFKIILVVFLGQNNCDIHLYNKIKERSFFLRYTLFVLSILIIFSGWYLNNLFSGNSGENLWSLAIIGDTNSTINHNHDNKSWLFETRYIFCYFGISFAFLNYLIIPKLGNNLKLKNIKLFKYYLKYFTSYDFSR